MTSDYVVIVTAQ